MIDIDKCIDNGKNLEIFSTSYFQSMNYYVENNLKWIEEKNDKSGKVDILELDILAKEFNTDGIKSTLIECKRGCTFNDFFMFTGIAQLIKANENILVCQSKQEMELKKMGESMGIKVQTPEDLAHDLLDKNVQELFLLFLDSNNISNLLFDKEKLKSIIAPSRPFTEHEKNAYNEIRKYMADLIGKIWRNTDLAEQATQIRGLHDNHPDFVREISRILDMKPGNKSSEFYMNCSLLCQAAGYLVLKVRISYIICAVQCAIEIENGVLMDLDKIYDENFIKVINFLRKDIKTAIKIPCFLQNWIYIFGGVLSMLDDKDLSNMANYLKMEKSTIYNIIKLLEELFTLSNANIQWGFIYDMQIISLKYIPLPIKGLGMKNRVKLGFSTEDFCFSKEWEESLKKFQI